MSPSKPIFMTPCEPLLQLLNCANKNHTSKSMKSLEKNRKGSGRGDADPIRFLKAVKVAFQYKMKNYDEFKKILRDFSAKRFQKNSLHISGVKAKVKSLFKGHTYLISEFNKFMPKEHRIAITSETYGRRGKFCELPWDVLGVISRKLDFEDLFQFSGACKNWRTFHKSNFLSSQEPFLVEISGHPRRGRPYRFISLPDNKVYNLKKMMREVMSYSNYTTRPMYVAHSSGYFIILKDNSTFLLINPFKRIKKVIYTSSPFELDYTIDHYHALLAFEKCSEEFVLVVLCKKYGNLHVYQSRNHGWVTYFRKRKPLKALDIVVFNNIIHIVTNKGNIGILSLNSSIIKFLELKNTPNIPFSDFNLVNCDDQLLLVGISLDTGYSLVYKIDCSTMSYVQLKTLGDIALFYVTRKSCKSLSNPNRWGFESNSVYEVGFPPTNYMLYSWDSWDKKFLEFPKPESLKSTYDWCCNLKYEVDYSLVD